MPHCDAAKNRVKRETLYKSTDRRTGEKPKRFTLKTMRGIVITDTTDPGALANAYTAHQLGAVKIVTAWGVSGGWSENVLHKFDTVPCRIVRTLAGDGLTLDPNAAMTELLPFYDVWPDMLIEPGNEPNRVGCTDNDIWVYRYNLEILVSYIRASMPRARVIMPAMMTDHTMDRWLAILGDLTPLFDFVGIHAYAWHVFAPTDTNQLATAIKSVRQHTRPYAARPIAITEMGINDQNTSPNVKMQRCRQTIAALPGDVAMTVCYHICDRPVDDDQRAYAIPLSALQYLR